MPKAATFLTLIQNNETEKSTDADKFYYGPAVVPPTTTTPEGIKTWERGFQAHFTIKIFFQ